MNTGKILEAFVEEIERILLPQDPTVTINRNSKVYDENGIQIAEFDIEVEGKIGSTRFRWLFECRDRPSEGPAPSAWIEQLVGRRNRFQFNKVIAVSTTGFASGAIQYAQESNIEIRTVTEDSLSNISYWLLTDKTTVLKRSGRLHHATLFVAEDEPEEIREALKNLLASHQKNDPILIFKETQQKMTPIEAFRSSFLASSDVDSLYAPIEQEGGSRAIRLQVVYEPDDICFMVETAFGLAHITQIIFFGELIVTKDEIPIADIRRYNNISTGDDIATTASFKFEVDGRSAEMSFYNISENGKIHVLLRGLENNPSPKTSC